VPTKDDATADSRRRERRSGIAPHRHLDRDGGVEYRYLDVQRGIRLADVSLNSDALLVSLVQVATSLPMFLFALAAGALADIFDKRRFLIGVEAATTLLSALFAALVQFGAVTPGSLLLFMFLIGVGGGIVGARLAGRGAAAGAATGPGARRGSQQRRHQHQPRTRAGAGRQPSSGWPASQRRSGSTRLATSASSVHCCGGAHRSAPPIACPRSDSAARCAPAFAMRATTRICARR